MSKPRPRISHTVAILIAIALIATGITMALRRPSKSHPAIQLTPEISIRLAAVLTDANSRVTLPGGFLSVPEQYTSWELVQFLNRTLPPRARITSDHSINASGLGPGTVQLVYMVSYPKQWLTKSTSHRIQTDLRAALDSKMIRFARVEISEGTYSSERNHINRLAYFVTRVSSGPERYYLTIDVDPPPFLQKFKIQFGDYILDPAVGEKVFKVGASDTLDNPYYKKITPLPNPVTLPTTQREGDYEVTLQAVVTRVNPDTDIHSFDQSATFDLAYQKEKPVIKNGAVLPEHFPAGTAADPRGYQSVIIMSLKKNGANQNEWQLAVPKISYGKEDLPINTLVNLNAYENGIVYKYSGDLTAYPGPMKVATQLDHVSNFLPNELATLDLPLPKAGEVLRLNAELATWNKKLKIAAIGYRTTETLTSLGVIPTGHEVLRAKPPVSDLFLLINSIGNVLPTELVLKGPGNVEYNLTQPKIQNYDESSLLQYKLNQNSTHSDNAPKTFDYADYTTLSLTIRDGRTSPTLYEFIVNPLIATGKPEPEKQ